MELAYFRILAPRIWKWPVQFFVFFLNLCTPFIVSLHLVPGLRIGGAKAYAFHCMYSDNTFTFTLTPQP